MENKKKDYAYLTKSGILHIVDNPNTAIEAIGRGKIVLTDIPNKYGYPVVDGEQVIVYGVGKMKHEAQNGFIEPISVLDELYKQCEGKE